MALSHSEVKAGFRIYGCEGSQSGAVFVLEDERNGDRFRGAGEYSTLGWRVGRLRTVIDSAPGECSRRAATFVTETQRQ